MWELCLLWKKITSWDYDEVYLESTTANPKNIMSLEILLQRMSLLYIN